jgi:hypothetical protein
MFRRGGRLVWTRWWRYGMSEVSLPIRRTA